LTPRFARPRHEGAGHGGCGDEREDENEGQAQQADGEADRELVEVDDHAKPESGQPA
jgi:hypothetical protein